MKSVFNPNIYFRKGVVMGKNKQKNSNQDVPFFDDQLGENKNNNGGGKKEQAGRNKGNK